MDRMRRRITPGAIACSLLLLPSLLLGASVDLAKTGQTTCYNQVGSVIPCAATGQDGEIQAGVVWPDPRFTNNGDGTITDNLTGLVWLKTSDCFGSKTWLEALAAANGLASGTCGLADGSSAGDWRLPNILELASLMHMGVANVATWLDSQGFDDLTALALYSSTTLAQGNKTSVFIFQYNDGFFGIGLKSAGYRTWPVRGASTGPAKLWKTGQMTCYDNLGAVIPCAGTGQDGEIQAGVVWPDPRFTNNGDGSVTDNLTGRTWLEDTNCFGDRIWSDAVSDANSLSDGDCSLTDNSSTGDWHIPNTWEILSLSDFSGTSRALPPAHPFTNLSGQPHWTSTTWTKSPSRVYNGTPGTFGIYWFGDKAPTYEVNAWPVRGEPGVVPPLFADGFESGDASAWTAQQPPP